MINRDDMLELTRRMNPSRNCFARIAGPDRSGDPERIDIFNVNPNDVQTEVMRKILGR